MKLKSKSIVAIAIILAVVVTCITGCTVEVSSSSIVNEPIGYLLIMHEDGEEHFEVLSAIYGNSYSTFYGVDGRTIRASQWIFIEY